MPCERPLQSSQSPQNLVHAPEGGALIASGFTARVGSKKVENHAHSVALFAMYYNFVRVHKTLRVTPAMAANVTKRLWEMSDIVDVLEAWEAAI